jgi:hypothetical protein
MDLALRDPDPHGECEDVDPAGSKEQKLTKINHLKRFLMPFGSLFFRHVLEL